VTAPRPAATPGWKTWRGIVGFGCVAAAAFKLFFTLPRTVPGLVAMRPYDDAVWERSASIARRRTAPDQSR
jgi:hypothetical protein